MVSLLAVAVCCIILVFPASVVAQTGPVRQAVLQSLRDSQWVRLATSDSGRRHGRLLEPGTVGRYSASALRQRASGRKTWTRPRFGLAV
jgi:hypothetical protein